MRKNQHVVPYGKQWAVKGEGNGKATGVYETQGEAFDVGREIAINQRAELFLHGRDGKIRERNSYGNDDFPPRG